MIAAVRWTWWLPVYLLAACASGRPPLEPSGAPVVAQVLGHPVRASDPDEMQYLILRELTDRFAAERGIAVSQAEVDAWLARQRQVLAADPNVGTTPDSPEDRVAREQLARAYVLQRKIDGVLLRQYGGRVAVRTGGAVPVDAYRRFLEEQAAQGQFRILDAAYEREFWRAWTDDARWHFVPGGGEAAARAFNPPAAPR